VSAVLAISVLALLLDRCLGEPRRWHPLVGFGALADQLEHRLNRGGARRWRGVLAWLLLLLPAVGVAALLQILLRGYSLLWFGVAAVFIVYLAIGRQSLAEHARAVALALRAADMPAARRAVGRIVSRDTQRLDATEISRATVESVLENGSDAVIASLFWFAVAGLPGVVLHRLANTLDAMWGYRNERFEQFGWAAARLDDLLNWIPARLTALAYALCGSAAAALRCWYRQARHWSSPNAGPVMAAGAGALQVLLGGAASYAGALEQRPLLGCARAPRAADIGRALRLLDRAVLLWLVLLAVFWQSWPR
jgi:adenosylcobinamide-phosphate synthase